MILPQSLQERLDRESYVSCLIDLTRTLCCEPKPTVENFTTVTHSVCIVLDEWASGGRDTAPYKEEVEWVYPFYKFTQSMRHIPSDKDGAGNEREYVIGGAEKKEIDDAMWDLYRDLEKISFQFKLRLTDARDPHVPLKRYGVKADCDLPWWWKPIFDCKEDGEGRLIQEIRKGVVGFSTIDLDDVLGSFKLLAADNAPPESDIRQEYDKFIQELDMSRNSDVRTTQEDAMENIAEDLSIELDFSPMLAYEKRVGEFAAKLYNPDHKLVAADFKWATEEACYALEQCKGGPDNSFPVGRKNFDWITPFINLIKALECNQELRTAYDIDDWPVPYEYNSSDYLIIDEGMERLVPMVERLIVVFKIFVPDEFKHDNGWWGDMEKPNGEGMWKVFYGNWLRYFLNEFRSCAIKTSEDKIRMLNEKLAASQLRDEDLHTFHGADPKPLFTVHKPSDKEPKQQTIAPSSSAATSSAKNPGSEKNEVIEGSVCRKTETQVREDVYNAYRQYRDKHESQNEAIEHAIKDNIVGIKHYQLWRGKKGKGEPGTSVDGCKRTLRDNGYDLSYAPAE